MQDAANYTITGLQCLRNHARIVHDFLLNIFELYDRFPSSLVPLFEPLLQQSDILNVIPLDFAKIPGLSNARSVPSAAYKPVPDGWDWEQERKALSSGFFLPAHQRQVRSLPSFTGQKEEAADVPCRELPRGSHHSHKTTNPGIITVHCVCHAKFMGFFVLKSKETPRHMFELLLTHWDQCPPLIIYDMACKFYKYGVLRAPEYFANSCAVIDSFHWPGHSHCPACFNITKYDILHTVNDQLTEQSNSRLIRSRKSLSYMSDDVHVWMTRFFTWLDESFRAGEHNE